MKNALKNYRVYIFGAILTVVGVGVPFLVLVITLNIENATPFPYPALLGAFCAVYLLIGFVWGDLYGVAYRRKNKNWDNELPLEIRTKLWTRRWPFYLACIVVFVVFMVFEIIFWITGSYPFI